MREFLELPLTMREFAFNFQPLPFPLTILWGNFTMFFGVSHFSEQKNHQGLPYDPAPWTSLPQSRTYPHPKKLLTSKFESISSSWSYDVWRFWFFFFLSGLLGCWIVRNLPWSFGPEKITVFSPDSPSSCVPGCAPGCCLRKVPQDVQWKRCSCRCGCWLLLVAGGRLLVVAHVVAVVVVVVIVVVVVVVVIVVVVVVVVFVVVVIVVFIIVIVVVVVVSRIAGQFSYGRWASRSVVFSHIMARDECPSKIHPRKRLIIRLADHGPTSSQAPTNCKC